MKWLLARVQRGQEEEEEEVALRLLRALGEVLLLQEAEGEGVGVGLPQARS